MASSPPRKLRIPVRLLAFFGVPALLIAIGAVGYRLIEGWSWFYSLYVSVITLTSIGYGERNPLSNTGRVFTMLLALIGIAVVALAATELLSIVVSGELREFWGKRRMRKRIGALDRHVIVCGYGAVGKHVCADLLGAGVPVVVIDRQEALFAAARDAGAHALLGDASADATLVAAGIARARALIAVAGSDADTVLVTMTARLLRPALPIVARVQDEAMVPKLARAGATLTVSPHAIAGGRIAQAVLRPAVFDLIEDAIGKERPEMRLEEVLVHPGSALDGKTVATSGIRSERERILVAIKRHDGQLSFNPDDDAPVAAGDILITLGRRERPDHADVFALSR